jgi:hypothetical protein
MSISAEPHVVAVPAAPPGPVLCWGVDSLAAAGEEIRWLWQGFLASGAVTLATSQWKSGKTTLATLVLAQMQTGGEVAGLSVARGRALVISEEPEQLWRQRCRPLGIVDHVGWFCRPFRGRPTPEQWSELIERVVEVHAQRDLALVAIDPLAPYVVGSENNARSMLDTLQPLERLTRLGLCVLALHHPKKGRTRAGQAARGSGALSGYVDILLEMGAAARAAPDDRRRRLRAFSRYAETPRQLAMELNAEGTAYRAIDTSALTVATVRREELVAVLEAASGKLPLAEVLLRWPAGREPDAGTLYRWLSRAVAEGVVCRDGSGRRRDPFRYWLFGQEERWARNPLAFLQVPEVQTGAGTDEPRMDAAE